MLIADVSVNDRLGKNGLLMNPYGPNILYLDVHEDILSKLDSYLKDFLNDDDIQKEIQDTIIAHSPDYTNDEGHSQYSTISSGFMKPIPPRFDISKNTFLGNVVYDLFYEYVRTYVINSNSDPSFRQFNSTSSDDNLRKKIETELENTKIEITDIWFVRMKEGDFHAMHDHISKGYASLSGGLYLNTPNVPFPQSLISWVRSGNAMSPFSNGSWGIQPKRGDAFIWPSWLSHHVYPFKGKDVIREMISFNAKLNYQDQTTTNDE